MYVCLHVGFCSAFVLCPCDVVKCRTQMRNMASSAAASRHGSVAAVVTDILRRRGPAGLYAGIPSPPRPPPLPIPIPYSHTHSNTYIHS